MWNEGTWLVFESCGARQGMCQISTCILVRWVGALGGSITSGHRRVDSEVLHFSPQFGDLLAMSLPKGVRMFLQDIPEHRHYVLGHKGLTHSRGVISGGGGISISPGGV